MASWTHRIVGTVRPRDSWPQPQPQPQPPTRLEKALALIAGGAGCILLIAGFFRRTILLTPVDRWMLEGALIAGLFFGVIVAVVWRRVRPDPLGAPSWRSRLRAWAVPVVLAALFCVAGSFGVEFYVEWQAFAGAETTLTTRGYVVIARQSGRRSFPHLYLRSDSGSDIDFYVSESVYQAVGVGDRLLLPVETGRSGVERLWLPDDPGALRRAPVAGQAGTARQ